MPVSHRLPLLLLALAVLAGGCASVKTLPGDGVSENTRLRRPAQIFVQPFATDDGMWQKDTAAPERRAEIRDWLSGRLLRHLAPIAPTRLLEEPVPSSGWLVTGRFLRVNPGSRVGRMLLGGLGAGASRLETRVDVFDLAVSTTEPILSFTTTGGSNLAAGIPGALAATDDDVDRTAREVHDFLEDRLWPADSEAGRPRVPGAIDEIDLGPAESNSR